MQPGWALISISNPNGPLQRILCKDHVNRILARYPPLLADSFNISLLQPGDEKRGVQLVATSLDSSYQTASNAFRITQIASDTETDADTSVRDLWTECVMRNLLDLSSNIAARRP
jgi:hypothetical protein